MITYPKQRTHEGIQVHKKFQSKTKSVCQLSMHVTTVGETAKADKLETVYF